VSTILILFLFAADLVKAPPAVPTDSGAIVVYSKGGGTVQWTANWTMAPGERDGRKVVRFTEQGQGRISTFPKDVKWSLEAVWSADNSFQPLDFEKTITGPDGSPLLTERKYFDTSMGSVRFTRQFSDGRSETKSLSAPADTLAVEGIAGVLRFLPFEGVPSFPVHLLSNEPKVYNVTLEARGKERVKTRAGEFECYKIEVVPHLGALNLFRAFFPKTFFWFTVAPPHFWVRFEGPENGPGTPLIVMELSGS
jgi:hypothetical protein